jgi:hypothetical protein
MKCQIPREMGDGSQPDWDCDGETTNKDGVCDKCKAAGWTGDPTEIAHAIANDPLLAGSVQIASSFQPTDV